MIQSYNHKTIKCSSNYNNRVCLYKLQKLPPIRKIVADISAAQEKVEGLAAVEEFATSEKVKGGLNGTF